MVDSGQLTERETNNLNAAEFTSKYQTTTEAKKENQVIKLIQMTHDKIFGAGDTRESPPKISNCSEEKPQGHVAATRPLVCADNFWHVQHEFLQHFVPATCCTKFNELNLVQHVSETKQLQSSCCACQKIISTHEWTCRCDMSLRLVPVTFSCVCTHCDFVAATCPRSTSRQCEQHMILSLLHVAATCPCDMSPRVRRT